MDLNAIAGPIVAAVNPKLPVTVQVSTGPGARAADGTAAPGYATPGALVGSIAGNVLTAASVGTGVLQIGQVLTGAGVLAGTSITADLGGHGGAGQYQVSQTQTVGSVAMTTAYLLYGQVQPLSWRDLQQLDGLNLGGVQWKIYLEGEIDAVVRSERRGGDLVTIPSGPHAGVWLVVRLLEQWPSWCCATITLQNGG